MAWPTTSDPKTEFVTLRFTKGEAADIDTRARAAGLTRSKYLRDCARRVALSEDKKAARLKGKEPKP